MNDRAATVLILLFTLLSSAALNAQESPPQVIAGVEPTTMPTATLGGRALQFVTGRATYQNRLPDQSGIEVQVFDEALNLVGVAQTDSQGVYAVAVPSDAFYWLVMDALLHRQQIIPIQPGELLPEVILAGGDFNNDGCVGPSDLAALVSALDVPGSAATDVTGDGITDVSDLAIVTGNYEPGCEPAETPVPEATTAVTPEVTPEATIEATPEIESTPEVTPGVEATPEVTPQETIEATQESIPEVTAEVTPEQTPEIEITDELTPEVTAEVTAEPPTPTLLSTPTEVPTQTPTASLTPEPTRTPTETPTEIVPERTEESTS
jgi:hypothetical protein